MRKNKPNEDIENLIEKYKTGSDEKLIETAYYELDEYTKEAQMAAKIILDEKYDIAFFEKENAEILLGVNNEIVTEYVNISLNRYIENKFGNILLAAALTLTAAYIYTESVFHFDSAVVRWIDKIIYALLILSGLRKFGIFSSNKDIKNWDLDQYRLNEYEERIVKKIIKTEKKEISFFKFKDLPVRKDLDFKNIKTARKKNILEKILSAGRMKE